MAPGSTGSRSTCTRTARPGDPQPARAQYDLPSRYRLRDPFAAEEPALRPAGRRGAEHALDWATKRVPRAASRAYQDRVIDADYVTLEQAIRTQQRPPPEVAGRCDSPGGIPRSSVGFNVRGDDAWFALVVGEQPATRAGAPTTSKARLLLGRPCPPRVLGLWLASDLLQRRPRPPSVDASVVGPCSMRDLIQRCDRQHELGA